MAQFLRPIADELTTGWTGSYTDIDETVASDADFIYSDDNPNSALNFELTNAGINAPSVNTGHIVRWRKALIDGGVLASDVGSGCTLDVELWQGLADVGTLIAQIRIDESLNAFLSWTADTYTLSEAEAGNITDYNDLHFQFHAKGGGGNPANRRGAGISWLEIEIPDGTASVDVDVTDTGVSAVWSALTVIATPYDQDAYNFIEAVGTLTTAQEIAINNLVLGLKANGTWTKHNVIYPFIGGTADSHKWNLKNPLDTDVAFRITWNLTGIVHDANGVLFDGTTGHYGETHYAPFDNVTLNSESIIFYSTSNNTPVKTDAIEVGAYVSGTQASFLSCLSTVNTPDGIRARFNASVLLVENTDARGLYAVGKNGNTTARLFKGGQSVYTLSSAGTLPTSTTHLGKLNLAAYTNGFSNQRLAFVALSNGLSDIEMSDDYDVIQAYETALGREYSTATNVDVDATLSTSAFAVLDASVTADSNYTATLSTSAFAVLDATVTITIDVTVNATLCTASFAVLDATFNNFEDEYNAVLQEAISLGFTLPSLANQTNQNQIIVDLKTGGFWSGLDCFHWVKDDGDFDFKSIDWCNPTGAKFIEIGTGALIVSDTGIKGDETNKLELGWNPTDFTSNYIVNDAFIGYEIVTAINTGDAFIITTVDGGDGTPAVNTRNDSYFQALNDGVDNLSRPVIDMSGTGVQLFDMLGTTIKVTIDGSPYFENSTYTFTQIPVDPIFVFSNGASITFFSDAEIGWLAFGSALGSDTNHADFYSAVSGGSANVDVTLTTASWSIQSFLVNNYETEYANVLKEGFDLGYTLPSVANQIIQNQIVKDLKDNSLWTTNDAYFYFKGDGDADFKKINWFDPTGTKASEEGAGALVWSSTGVKGDGTNLLNLGYNPTLDGTNYLQNDFGIGIDVVTAYSAEAILLEGLDTGSRSVQLRNSSTFHYLHSNSSTSTILADASGVGFFVFEGLSGTNYLFKNGVSVKEETGKTTDSFPDDTFNLFAAFTLRGDSEVGSVIIRASLGGNTTNHTNLYNSIIGSSTVNVNVEPSFADASFLAEVQSVTVDVSITEEVTTSTFAVLSATVTTDVSFTEEVTTSAFSVLDVTVNADANYTAELSTATYLALEEIVSTDVSFSSELLTLSYSIFSVTITGDVSITEDVTTSIFEALDVTIDFATNATANIPTTNITFALLSATATTDVTEQIATLSLGWNAEVATVTGIANISVNEVNSTFETLNAEAQTDVTVNVLAETTGEWATLSVSVTSSVDISLTEILINLALEDVTITTSGSVVTGLVNANYLAEVASIETVGAVDVNPNIVTVSINAEEVTVTAIRVVSYTAELSTALFEIQSITVDAIENVDVSLVSLNLALNVLNPTVVGIENVDVTADLSTANYTAEDVTVNTATNVDINVTVVNIALVSEEVNITTDVDISNGIVSSSYSLFEATITTDTTITSDITNAIYTVEEASVSIIKEVNINVNLISATFTLEEESITTDVSVSLGVNSLVYQVLGVSVSVDAETVLDALVLSYQDYDVSVTTDVVETVALVNGVYELLDPSIIAIENTEVTTELLTGEFLIFGSTVNIDGIANQLDLSYVSEVLDVNVDLQLDVYVDTVLLSLGIDPPTVSTEISTTIEVIPITYAYTINQFYLDTVVIKPEILKGISAIKNTLIFDSQIQETIQEKSEVINFLSKFSKIK